MTEPLAEPENGPRPAQGMLGKLHRAEDAFNLAILVAMATLPLVEMVVRIFGGHTLPGLQQYVAVLTLWIGFSGAMLATRDHRHLSLSTGLQILRGNPKIIGDLFSVVVAVVVTAVLARGAYHAVDAERGSTQILPGGIPAWWAQVIMPLGYAVIAVRLAIAGFTRNRLRVAALVLSALALFLIARASDEFAEGARFFALSIVLLATVLGAPIFVALGGAAVVLFWSEATPVAAVAAETVRQITSPTMPTIPLFTFAGYVLAESKASTRLVRAVRALVGSLPGGIAVMVAVVCAFFTTFTGASGVTILALGGLLYPMLLNQRYPEGFSVGLLTASGSIGLLFPPSLPVIFYGVVAHVPIDQMFVAGLLPGVLLVLAVSAMGVVSGIKNKAERTPFDLAEARAALWDAKWELVVPLIVLASILFGLATLVEAAAVTAFYVLFIETVVHRDLAPRDLPRVGRECATLVGGVLIILGVALGLTSYLVDAEIPAAALEWAKTGITSKYTFLLVLNLFLLVVGCLMDIFSAIVVVVPLILPIGQHFGIHPLHLGMIFLANLELGFMTPPVGMNLFLASFRFKKPLPYVYKVSLPFLLVLLVAVLLITYVPVLTTGPVELLFDQQVEAPIDL